MFKRVWYKIYYGIVIFFLVREHRKQWDKCLELQGSGHIARLATEFRKSENIRKQIELEREKNKMKITKERLKMLIKEELSKVLKEEEDTSVKELLNYAKGEPEEDSPRGGGQNIYTMLDNLRAKLEGDPLQDDVLAIIHMMDAYPAS